MKKKIVVFGSCNVDLTSWCRQLPRPGETVFSDTFKMGPGGKGGNQAVAAHRAGGDVTYITKIGNDALSEIALKFYRDEKMDTSWFLVDEVLSTGVALICVEESGQNQILVCPGACTGFTKDDIEKIRPVIAGADILLMQFEVNLDALELVIDIAKENNVYTVLNTAPVRDLPDGLISKVDCVTPNEVEAEGLTGIKVNTYETAEECAKKFHAMGIGQVVITLGDKGVFASDGVSSKLSEAYKVDAVDTTGAGDAFNGALVASLAEGNSLFEAVEFANRVAALSVTKHGAAPSMPMRHEIDAFKI